MWGFRDACAEGLVCWGVWSGGMRVAGLEVAGGGLRVWGFRDACTEGLVCWGVWSGGVRVAGLAVVVVQTTWGSSVGRALKDWCEKMVWRGAYRGAGGSRGADYVGEFRGACVEGCERGSEGMRVLGIGVIKYGLPQHAAEVPGVRVRR